MILLVLRNTLNMLSFTNIALIILLFLILFGAKRIPDIMKDLGKGLKNFKDGLEDANEKESDDKPKKESKKLEKKSSKSNKKKPKKK